MADISMGQVTDTARRSSAAALVRRLVSEKPLGAVGAVITLLLLLTGIFAGVLAPYGMNQTWAGDSMEPPSARFWLGTDNVGRDILSRMMYGARISLIVGLAGSAIATGLCLIIGVVTGYVGGKLDLVVQRLVDATMCFPDIVLLIVMISIVGQGTWQVVIVLGSVWGIRGSRIVRSAVIGMKEHAYVTAAVSIGCSTAWILVRHILPNIVALAIFLFSSQMPGIILTEATLSFLGFGVPAPNPSWGGMLSGSGRTYMFQAPWMALWPGVALAIVVFGLNMFGDALRDLLDPRLKGGSGRYGRGGKKRGQRRERAQSLSAN